MRCDKVLILVDWSNLLYRAWYASREESWIAYCKFFDMLRACVHKSKIDGVPIEIIFAGESRSKLKRKEISENYKANRKYPENLEFREYRKRLAELLNTIGWPLISVPGAEADDVIASIVNDICHRCTCSTPCKNCKCANKYTTNVIIFSADKDLQQLLAWERVKIYKAPGIFIDKEWFEKEYGIPVNTYGYYKALIGDKSDNIKGVKGFGPVKARTSILKNSIFEDIHEIGGEEAFESFKKALNLIMLDCTCKYNLDIIKNISIPDISQLNNSNINYRILLEIKRLKEEMK